MRDLQDKFLVRAWLVDPTARIVPRTGVGAQGISLEKSNLLQLPSLHSTAAGRIVDSKGEGQTRADWECVGRQGFAGASLVLSAFCSCVPGCGRLSSSCLRYLYPRLGNAASFGSDLATRPDAFELVNHFAWSLHP